MNINWKCDGCGQPLITDSKYVGGEVECPKCKRRLVVPTTSANGERETVARPPVSHNAGDVNVPEIAAVEVQRLRNETGLGLMICKKALEKTDGDFRAAKEFLSVVLKEAGGDTTAAEDILREKGVFLAPVSTSLLSDVHRSLTYDNWVKETLGKQAASTRKAKEIDVHTSGRSDSVVSSCKQWRCPGCNVLLEKGALGTVWFPGDSIDKVHGTGTCPNCGRSFPQADIYGAKYDYEEQAGARTETCPGCGANLQILPDVRASSVSCPGCGTRVSLR